jgi:hypothetical protein
MILKAITTPLGTEVISSVIAKIGMAKNIYLQM